MITPLYRNCKKTTMWELSLQEPTFILQQIQMSTNEYTLIENCDSTSFCPTSLVCLLGALHYALCGNHWRISFKDLLKVWKNKLSWQLPKNRFDETWRFRPYSSLTHSDRRLLEIVDSSSMTKHLSWAELKPSSVPYSRPLWQSQCWKHHFLFSIRASVTKMDDISIAKQISFYGKVKYLISE